MIIKLLACFVLFVFMLSPIRGQEVIRLYESRAPGFAGSDMEEKITFSPTGFDYLCYVTLKIII
jgi:hypothetical protein